MVVVCGWLLLVGFVGCFFDLLLLVLFDYVVVCVDLVCVPCSFDLIDVFVLFGLLFCGCFGYLVACWALDFSFWWFSLVLVC